MSLAACLNTAWMWKCRAERRAFHRSTRNVAYTQSEILRATLQANRETWFGRRYGFASITDPAEYQKCVPLATVDDYRQPIDLIAAGELNVLTREPVKLLEPTSGSSGAEKLIPYTASLRKQFQRGVATWIADLFQRRPAVRQGRAYWSISPILGPKRRSPGGLPIGFDDDAAYLGTFEQWALRRLLVMPAAAARIDRIEAFRYVTLLKLLQADDLSLVSIWSPTFLTSLLASLENWSDQICEDIERGGLRGAKGLAPDVIRALAADCRPMPRRAGHLREVFRTSAPLADKLSQTWPRLSLISCWADAAAALPLDELHTLFPRVEVQPKGLLATEGFVSLPLCDQPAPALALRSHFFEFVEAPTNAGQATDSPRTLLAHQLDRGEAYRVVLTTAGGLYRYQLQDKVEVVGFLNECPLLRFLGKADRTCDLVGEKLNEPHVHAVLQEALKGQRLSPRFAMVVPVVGPPARYRLYLQLLASANPLDTVQLRSIVETGLAENPHYRYALGLGQLAPLEICVLDRRGECGSQIAERQLLLNGQRAGDIKPMALGLGTDWPDAFRSLEQAGDSGADGKQSARCSILGSAR